MDMVLIRIYGSPSTITPIGRRPFTGTRTLKAQIVFALATVTIPMRTIPLVPLCEVVIGITVLALVLVSQIVRATKERFINGLIKRTEMDVTRRFLSTILRKAIKSAFRET